MKLLAIVCIVLGMFYLNLDAKLDAICKVPTFVNGNCSVRFERWSYNVTENKCVFIEFGGCHMTVNQFRTQKNCEKKCLHKKKNIKNDSN